MPVRASVVTYLALAALSVALAAAAGTITSATIPADADSASKRAGQAALAFAEGTISGRLAATDHLKRAIEFDPSNADYHLMLAEVYFAATFWSYGIRELERALDLDPARADARARLGRAYYERALEEWQMPSFLEARRQLKRAVSADPGLSEAAVLLALCRLDLGEPDSALAVLARLPESALDADALLLTGLGRQETGDVEGASEAFHDALARMDDVRRHRYLTRDIIDRSGLPGAATPTENLWKREDPNPATPVNERLVEHLARVAFSDFHFSVPRTGKLGSKTTRGEVYIRYGRPLRWYYDPFGTSTYAGETVFPDPAALPFEGEELYKDLASLYRARPLRVRKPRWVWHYKDFVLAFEDTYMNGDFTFPYEQDWSAYVYAYLQKNLPRVYESEIRRRMRVAVDALAFLDGDGQPAVRVVYACDTRGIEYSPGLQRPAGRFETSIAMLDSTYESLAEEVFEKDLLADSTALGGAALPLVGTWVGSIPAGAELVAVSMKSKANGALGYALAEVRPRAFTESLDLSDLELRLGHEGPANPEHAYVRGARIYVAFSAYRGSAGPADSAELEITCNLLGTSPPPTAFRRFLGRISGTAGAARLTSLSRSCTLEVRGNRADQVIGMDTSSLVEGPYDLEVTAIHRASGNAKTVTTWVTVSKHSDL
jgi:GWxTD domain-containing protein